MFLNDGLVASNTAATVGATLNTGALWFGNHQSWATYYLLGSLSDLRIYNRALSASEVQQLYAYESQPIVTLLKAVSPSFSNLTITTNYQLQVSSDLSTWTNQGSPFTATNTSMICPQYWDVDNWSQLFFRLQAATWASTDDFSGTLAKWDTTYIHADQPNDGFFLSNGHLQFIKTVTTTAYGSSGALIWSNSLPFNTNWTVLVDAHLKPSSVKSSNPIDQDIRAALYAFESIDTLFGANPKRLKTALGNGVTNDVIQMDGPDLPVTGGGWDFTLGLSFDSSTKTGISFYYPSNQPSQLVTLTNLNMSGWTNMQIMLYGLSEYWAVGSGEVSLDNFRSYGFTNSSSNPAIVRAVRPSFSNLSLGTNYQLRVSSDLNTWTNQGSALRATNTSMVYPQYWDVDNWNKLFFRLQVAP